MKLVLMPGMDGTGALFSGFIDALAGSFEIVIVRYPSDVFLCYSESAPLVRSVIPIDDPFVLLAESFSTPIAIQFAATHPPNLKGLILCTGFVSSPRRGLLRIIASLFAPFLFRGTLPKFADPLLLGPNAPSALRTALRSALSRVPPRVLAARLRAVLACDVRDELARIAVPILFLRATRDRLVPGSRLEEILKIKPQINVASIEGPHLLLQREPQVSAEIVRQFLLKFT